MHDVGKVRRTANGKRITSGAIGRGVAYSAIHAKDLNVA
jgi:hypothetical protein